MDFILIAAYTGAAPAPTGEIKSVLSGGCWCSSKSFRTQVRMNRLAFSLIASAACHGSNKKQVWTCVCCSWVPNHMSEVCNMFLSNDALMWKANCYYVLDTSPIVVALLGGFRLVLLDSAAKPGAQICWSKTVMTCTAADNYHCVLSHIAHISRTQW